MCRDLRARPVVPGREGPGARPRLSRLLRWAASGWGRPFPGRRYSVRRASGGVSMRQRATGREAGGGGAEPGGRLASLLPAGEPVESLLRKAQFFTPGTPSEDYRELHRRGGRGAEEFYRDRWRHDKEVRSTHGVNCTGSCSWKVYVKDGIITWETQQTDYPSVGPDSPEQARQTSSSCGCSETGHPDRRGFPDPQTGDAGACTTAASPHRHPGVSMRRYLSCRRCRPLPRQACAAGPGRVLWRSCLDCQIRITGPLRPGRARGSGRRAPLNQGLASRAGWRACR